VLCLMQRIQQRSKNFRCRHDLIELD
jgi:hypothetical protein